MDIAIESEGFKHLKTFFRQISDAKVKDGILVYWPQIRKPLKRACL